MHFKMAQDVKVYFSNIINVGGSHGAEDKNKFIMFDPYYCCALIGMGSCELDSDESGFSDLINEYPSAYKDYKSYIAGLLVATEAKRKGIDLNDPRLESMMLEYLSSDSDTFLTDEGVKTLNAYSRKGARIYQEYFPVKPESREEFLEAFKLLMQTETIP